MGNFTNAQKPAPNPWIIRNGHVASPADFYGLSVLPAMNPCRAQTSMEWDDETSEMVEVEGFAPCMTEVVEWPFSEDDAGVSFPVSSIYGVRTRVYRQTAEDGGGDKYNLVAVPRVLPEGYTAVGRCHILPSVFGDFLGENALEQPPTWNHRTPTGWLLDTSTSEGLARSAWVPMNFNQQVIESSVGVLGVGWTIKFDEDGNQSWKSWRAAGLVSSHVGFRGGKLMVTYLRPVGVSFPVTVERDVTIVCGRTTDNDADPWISEAPPAWVENKQSLSLSHTFATPSDGNYTEEISVDALLPSLLGIPCVFFMTAEPLASVADGDWLTHITMSFQLSPRVDVPLFYFASHRNRCAPGGIIVPP